ncbi:MAG: peptidoglycan-binding domain-containing protein [Acidobacteriota bacterium]
MIKKSSAAKNSKQKKSTQSKSKKAAKGSAKKVSKAKSRSTRRRGVTVAKNQTRSKTSGDENDGNRVASSTSEKPLTPEQTKNYDSPEEPDENQASQAPAIRPVISSIPTERVAEIQSALIKNGYLQGEATGVYDETTKAAMKKYQVANNLQATGLPSAHALKRLGVGKRGYSLSQVPVKTKSDAPKEPPQE